MINIAVRQQKSNRRVLAFHFLAFPSHVSFVKSLGFGLLVTKNKTVKDFSLQCLML